MGTPRLSLFDRRGEVRRASSKGCSIRCDPSAALSVVLVGLPLVGCAIRRRPSTASSSKRTLRPPTVGERGGLSCPSSVSSSLSLSESETAVASGRASSGGTVGYGGLYPLLSFSNSFACFSTRSLRRVYLSAARACFLRRSGSLSQSSPSFGDSSQGSSGTRSLALAQP